MIAWIYAFASTDGYAYSATTWPANHVVYNPDRKKEAYLRRYRRGKKATK